MRSRFLATVVACGLAGCAEDPQHLEDPADDLPTKPIHTATPEHAIDTPEAEPREAAEAVRCEPMSDEGPCSLVCDRDALLDQYVPAGTCIHFACTAHDGTRHHLGACR